MANSKVIDDMMENRFQSLGYRYTVFGFVYGICSDEVSIVFRKLGYFEDFEEEISPYIDEECNLYGLDSDEIYDDSCDAEEYDRRKDFWYYSAICDAIRDYTVDKLHEILEDDLQYEIYVNKTRYACLDDENHSNLLNNINNLNGDAVYIIGDDVNENYIAKVNTDEKEIPYVNIILDNCSELVYKCDLID